MSVVDHELDEEDEFCKGCSMPFNDGRALCQDCRMDTCDMYADEALQDRLEGRRK